MDWKNALVRHKALIVVILLLVTVLLVVAATRLIVDGISGPDETAPQSHSSLLAAIAALPVAEEKRAGYERELFPHWIDADGDGCDTRKEVLLAEATTGPRQERECRLRGGRWYSYYDNTFRTQGGKLDVDHMVPLAEAWDSGAYAWSTERRQAFANDLDDERTLVAVTTGANRSKSDQDPAEWIPPYAEATCRYIGDWVAVKTRWDLRIDPAERDTLTQYAQQCDSIALTVTPG